MYHIFYIQPLHPEGMNYLRQKEGYYIQVATDTSRETLLREAKDADVIVTRLTKVDAELMTQAKHLKAVCKHGVGVDNIDTAYCREHGIAVLTTGDANSSTVAEQTMIVIGALLRKTLWLDRQMRSGDWGARDRANGQDLMGKTLGLIGYGRIGKCLARMAAKGFLMQVRIYDPYLKREDAAEEGYIYEERLDHLLKSADVVSLHVPLTEQTRGMIGKKEMEAMKDGAYLINYSRGGIIDEKALYESLASGHLAGAALDVYEQEPPPTDLPLFSLENVIVTPHCGTFTEDSRRRMSMRLAQEIERVLESK